MDCDIDKFQILKTGQTIESLAQKGQHHMGGLPVHSQVRKIKQESEKIIDWSPGQPEMRPVLREITRQISRSPLGISY
ncbi:hypothetical protein CFP56_032725 [Quercus suber]|uniref:Uncharacterized protein n=1 Tax=Quercus suber TaxID=58331 RepID=A0AAW0JG53_QUESU